jgi:hypothetical protein
MPISLNDDILFLLDLDDFAVSASYDGGTIQGIFDNETVPVDAGGFAQVHKEQPRFTCRTADVPSVAEDQAIVISGVTYAIKAWVHDGTGVTTLQLEKS